MAKETRWYGKSPEEIKVMSLEEFAKFLPSRARRKLKRGLTDAEKIFLNRLSKKDKLRTHCRDMLILPQMLNRTIMIYNGKEYFPITVVPEMLGHSLGEFSIPTKPVKHSAAGIGATRSSKAISAK